MPPHETSSADAAIDAALRAEPPAAGAILSGWVAVAEWTKPSGERILVLMGAPEESVLQMKGHLHDGLLNVVWRASDKQTVLVTRVDEDLAQGPTAPDHP